MVRSGRRRSAQSPEKFRSAGTHFGHLIWDSGKLVELSADIYGRDDRVGPAPAHLPGEGRRTIKIAGHKRKVLMRRGEGRVPLLEDSGRQPGWNLLRPGSHLFVVYARADELCRQSRR